MLRSWKTSESEETWKLRREDKRPEVAWTVKVDGRLGHGFQSTHLTRKIQDKIIGDVGFADDTTVAEEMRCAEPLLERTMKDWCENIHPGKIEGLRLQGTKRKLTDVRYKGSRGVKDMWEECCMKREERTRIQRRTSLGLT